MVGGYVDSYVRKKQIDRYEAVCSALNMGNHPALGCGDRCVFYVPTCNMLVRRSIYQQIGGLDEKLRIGEDVDLCWRLMMARYHLYYAISFKTVRFTNQKKKRDNSGAMKTRKVTKEVITG